MSIFGSTFDKGVNTFSDESWLTTMIDVELSLLAATEAVGLVPEQAAAEIRAAWEAAEFTVAKVSGAAGDGANPLIPLVIALKSALPSSLRKYVHLGATSQDIIDTSMMLMARQALLELESGIATAGRAAADLAEQHAAAVIPGRTLMQDALPTTFGFKAAGWSVALNGVGDRLGGVRQLLPVQYGGPVGTLTGTAGLGTKIRSLLAVNLGLADPSMSWHTLRLPIADLAGALGTAGGIVGKIAGDLVLLAQTAVAEVGEGTPGRGGSSSMPHKQNPVAAISARACAKRTPGLVATLFAAMDQEHERAAGGWHAEWETVADLFRLTRSAVNWLADSLAHLKVDTAVMRAHAEQLGQQLDTATAVATVREMLRQQTSHHGTDESI